MANIGYDHMQSLNIFSQNNQVFYPYYSPDTTGMWQYCYDFMTGIEEKNQISFSFSPNPAHNQITISSKQQSDENTQLKIYDTLGKQVRELKIISPRTVINCSGLSNGIYFYQIINNKGILTNGKLIKE